MAVIATAGHVDHGKSSLVRALTGTDPDRFEEEKRRGMTIDLGFAWTELPSGREVGFVDVPGHHRFIGNMLAGVGSIDAILFVVAANEGWMPQSEEHLAILELLGVEPGSRVALNLAGVDHADVTRGDAIVFAKQWHVTDRLDAQLLAVPGVELAPKGAYTMHVGTAHTSVRLQLSSRGDFVRARLLS